MVRIPIDRRKNTPDALAEIARDHPEAERLGVWLVDEALVGQTGVIIRRSQDWSGEVATLDGDGRSYEEIAAGREAAAA